MSDPLAEALRKTLPEVEGETRDARLKRLRMRSWRRGTKEMDMILGPFADSALPDMGEDRLSLFDALLWENDQEIHQWVTGKIATPEKYQELLFDITKHAFNS